MLFLECEFFVSLNLRKWFDVRNGIQRRKSETKIAFELRSNIPSKIQDNLDERWCGRGVEDETYYF
jgi:hypothetical protein